MNAKPGGRVLIASNRGPVSFTMGYDGKLTSRRGGGGVVSGLSAVADQAEVLWVCAALSDADRAAARAAPNGYLNLSLSGANGQSLDSLTGAEQSASRPQTAPDPAARAPDAT
ncbi:MAG TPA: hypothetical protein VIV12_05320, partial [Streptosporangiaceae bacterium]